MSKYLLQTKPWNQNRNKKETNQLTLQRNDLAGRVHDGRISRDWPTDGVVRVAEVNYHDLSRLSHLFSDTDELIRLHGQGTKPNVSRIDANILELKVNKQNPLIKLIYGKKSE